MKRTKKLVALALALVMALAPIPVIPDALASVEDFEFHPPTGSIIGYTGDGGDVTIPDSIGGTPVTAISSGAFMRNNSITSITVPDSVTSIGSSAFSECSALTSVTLSANLEAIERNLFTNCHKLESVVIPNKVKSIGESAFRFCYALESIVIPDSVISIGKEAFLSHRKLANVTIGNSVETIGDEAFQGDLSSINALSSIHIPASVTSIGYRVFERCDSLTEITVDAGNTAYASENGVLFNKAKTVLIRYPENKADASYAVPDGVARIEGYAFSWNDKIKNVTIPTGVTAIDERAFNYCTALEAAVLPDGLEIIGDYSFYWCRNIASVIWPTDGSLKRIGTRAFEQCQNLDSTIYNIPDSVYSIGRRAFFATRWHSYSPAIPSRVRYVGKVAYDWWYEWPTDTEITLIDGTIGIADSAFAEAGDKLISVVIPGSVKHIGNHAFNTNTGLTAVDMAPGVKTIGDGAFQACSALSDINIPDTVETIGDSAFRACTVLEDVRFGIDSELKAISDSAFSGCTGLERMYLPDGLLNIGNYAFSTCTKLADITVPDSVEHVGFGAFGASGASSDTAWYTAQPNNAMIYVGKVAWSYKGSLFDDPHFKIKEGTKSISEHALSYKTLHFTGITIPDTVKSIGASAFTGSTHLSSAFILGNDTIIGEYAFHQSMGAGTFRPLPNIKIYGNPGSEAEAYALANSIPFAEYRTVTLTASSAAHGTVSGPEVVEAGSSVTVIAAAALGYAFEGWYENGAKISGAGESYTFTAEQNRVLEARFVPFTYRVIYDGNDANGGTVPTDSGTYGISDAPVALGNPGNLVRTGWTFEGWSPSSWGGDPIIKAGESIPQDLIDSTFTSRENLTLYAVWQWDSSYVNINVYPGLGGTASGSGAAKIGTMTTVTAAPYSGYAFDGWYEWGHMGGDAARVSQSLEYTFEVTTSRTLQARFKQTGAAVNVPTAVSKTANSITVNAVTAPVSGQTVEYAISTGTTAPATGWQTTLTFTGLTANTTYYVFARSMGDNNYNTGAPVRSAAIITDKAALSGTVSVTGTVRFGSTLTANTSGLTTNPSGANKGALSYQWKRGDQNISGATKNTYKLVQADIGKRITVTVTATNCTGSVTSAQTAAIAKANATAPGRPAAASITHNSVTLKAVTGMEYRLGSGKWQSSPTFTGLKKNTKYSFTMRLKETATHNASGAGAKLDVTTLQVTATPNNKAVPKSKTAGSGYRVTLSAPANTTLYYTTNGKAPTTNSTKINPNKTKTLTIHKDTTVRVIAVRKGQMPSGAVTRNYRVR